MESSRYWQNYCEMVERKFMNGQGRRVASLAGKSEDQGGGVIVYGGREMSREVYLAVPTFIRRGITLGV